MVRSERLRVVALLAHGGGESHVLARNVPRPTRFGHDCHEVVKGYADRQQNTCTLQKDMIMASVKQSSHDTRRCIHRSLFEQCRCTLTVDHIEPVPAGAEFSHSGKKDPEAHHSDERYQEKRNANQNHPKALHHHVFQYI